mgnify:CR=1 FL=1
MGHFAKVENGKVINVIVAEPEFFNTFVDTSPGEWIQTSYNTRGNKHYNPSTGEEDSNVNPPLRGNYAGIGFIYDRENDVFYPQKPHESWILDKDIWLWKAPIPYPSDGNNYFWDEEKQSWINK